jgi:methionyl-tRNA formyltransferase
MEEENPELIITISFGEILPEFVIDYPKYKCLNVHYSLLPKYRGAVPVQAAILAGDQKTGVTIQVMAAKLDEGPVIAQKEVKIEDDETTPTLKSKLIPAGTNLLMETLPKWIAEEIEARPQGKCEGPYCCTGDISKKSAHIKWNEMEPQYIERVVRAMLPWPVAWTFLPDGKRLKIFEATIEDINHSKNAGELFKKDKFIYFATKYPHKAIKLETVQKEGKQKLSGKQFACGYKINK